MIETRRQTELVAATRNMTPDHKQALAEGRSDARVVKAYLEAIVATRPKRGRKRTRESITERLRAIEATRGDAAPLTALHLAQERLNLEAELAALDATPDSSAAERVFVEVAKRYSARKGISYAAWREAGVAPETLKRAGIGKRG
jgi:hypothetical protein